MNLCLRCRRRLRTCVCEQIRPFQTNSRFLILMHPMEYKKEKLGTGRFSHLILKNSEILVDVGFDENKRFRESISDSKYQTVVLYPGDQAHNLSHWERPQFEEDQRPLQIIVIDATWPCAKKMMKLTTSVHQLPRISFDPSRHSEFKIKHQPLPGCLSTVESIHQVLLELNRLGLEKTERAEENLMEVFRKTVEVQIELSNDPDLQGYRRKPYSLPSERKISKKWKERLLFFRPE